MCFHIKEGRLAVSSSVYRINSVAVDCLKHKHRNIRNIHENITKLECLFWRIFKNCPPHMGTLPIHGSCSCSGFLVAPGVTVGGLAAPLPRPAGIIGM